MQAQLIERSRQQVEEVAQPMPIRAARQRKSVGACEGLEKERVLHDVAFERAPRQRPVGESAHEVVLERQRSQVGIRFPQFARQAKPLNAHFGCPGQAMSQNSCSIRATSTNAIVAWAADSSADEVLSARSAARSSPAT